MNRPVIAPAKTRGAGVILGHAELGRDCSRDQLLGLPRACRAASGADTGRSRSPASSVAAARRSPGWPRPGPARNARAARPGRPRSPSIHSWNVSPGRRLAEEDRLLGRVAHVDRARRDVGAFGDLVDGRVVETLLECELGGRALDRIAGTCVLALSAALGRRWSYSDHR